MVSEHPDLDPLFAPESIALVGASPDSTYASGLFEKLDYGYEGDVYLVNPNRAEVWGQRCYDTITDVPAVVDLTIVSVPREYVVDVVDDAGEMGVPAALVITAGFSEADSQGAELESELVAVAEKHGIRVCGPNSLGLSNMHDKAILKAGSGIRRPVPGSIGLVSQSGALAFTTFYERGADEDIDFAYIVSTGNEAVLTATDYIAYLSDDQRVDVICAYIEGVDDPREFMRVAEKSTRNGTPVLAVKIGQSEFSEAATISHTGSLVGNDDAWEAAFTQTGVERVPDIPDLLGRASAHAAYDHPTSNRICVASTSGGLTSLLADMAGERDLELPSITGETEQALVDMDQLLTFGEMHNPADIRGYGASVLPEIADVLFADDSFDAYVFALGLSGVDERAQEVADDVLSIADRAPDPVFFLWTGRKDPAELPDPQPYERVRKEVPLFYDPERCMDALASLVRFNEWRDRYSSRPSRGELLADLDSAGSELSLPSAQVFSWKEAERLLSQYDVPVLDTQLVTNADEAAAASAEFETDVVLKVDSPDIPHRTDADAVRTDISSPEAARETFAEIIENSRDFAPDADINGVLVQPKIDSGVEALVGASTDELFGPLVTVGLGGTFAESLQDRAIRIPPFTSEEGLDAIEETALGNLLEDTRTASVSGGQQLAEVMQNVGQLVVERDQVVELDLNPLLVHDGRVVAADVLIRTS